MAKYTWKKLKITSCATQQGIQIFITHGDVSFRVTHDECRVFIFVAGIHDRFGRSLSLLRSCQNYSYCWSVLVVYKYLTKHAYFARYYDTGILQFPQLYRYLITPFFYCKMLHILSDIQHATYRKSELKKDWRRPMSLWNLVFNQVQTEKHSRNARFKLLVFESIIFISSLRNN